MSTGGHGCPPALPEKPPYRIEVPKTENTGTQMKDLVPATGVIVRSCQVIFECVASFMGLRLRAFQHFCNLTCDGWEMAAIVFTCSPHSRSCRFSDQIILCGVCMIGSLKTFN